MDLDKASSWTRTGRLTRTLSTGLLLALVLSGGSVRGEGDASAPGRLSGMWVWPAEAYQAGEPQTRLLRFCRDHQFNHLDVHVRMDERDGRATLTDEQDLAALLKRAGAANVSVNALRGSQKMFFGENHARTLRELQAILDFNQRQPAGARFAGVKYDVEPQTLDEWRRGGAGREKIMRDYLACLAKLRHALEGSAPKDAQLRLTVDIPFWWGKEELKLEHAGATRPFSYHVQDLTDSVTLMSYRRDPELVKQLVEHERAYAARTGKSVLPSLLHSKSASPSESSLSFYGLPTSDYLRARRELEQWAAGRPGIGGVMHHHYGSLSQSLESEVAKTPNP